jgi:hypothetical protein
MNYRFACELLDMQLALSEMEFIIWSITTIVKASTGAKQEE